MLHYKDDPFGPRTRLAHGHTNMARAAKVVEKMKELFDAMDKDGNGVLDRVTIDPTVLLRPSCCIVAGGSQKRAPEDCRRIGGIR